MRCILAVVLAYFYFMKGVDAMIQAEFQVCILDEKIIEDSEIFKVLVKEIGEENALKWTYAAVVPLDETEVV